MLTISKQIHFTPGDGIASAGAKGAWVLIYLNFIISDFLVLIFWTIWGQLQ